MLLLLAGSLEEAEAAAEAMGLPRCRWQYVSEADSLRMVNRGARFVRVGSFQEREDAELILAAAEDLGAQEVIP